MTKRGLFILFEGLDGCGKTTQAKILQESGFLGESVQQVFPDPSTMIGGMCRQYLTKSAKLNDQVIHLLFCANRWELSEQIQEKLNSGISVICDRYWYSGVAYSAAKGLSLDWCKGPETGLPEPDLVIFLEIDPKQLSNRRGFGDEIYEKLDFQVKVRNVYQQLKGPHWAFVDGSLPIEQVTEKIKEVIAPYLNKNNNE